MTELSNDDLRKLDYEKTLEFVSQLSDIRFKLLALVPIATGSAVGLADPEKYPLPGLFLGLLGFFVTLGILFYDERNTEIYEKEMHRARLLEFRLNIPSTSERDTAGGPVGGRGGRGRKLFGIVTMWHDRGLALIYSAVLGVWFFLITASALVLLPGVPTTIPVPLTLVLPLAVSTLFCYQLHKLDTPSPEIRSLKTEINALEEGSARTKSDA